MLVTQSKVQVADLINYLISSERSFAIYKLPDEGSFHFIYSEEGFQPIDKVDFNNLPTGFVFAPYNRNFSSPLFLKAQHMQHLKPGEAGIEMPELNLEKSKEKPNNVQGSFTLERVLQAEEKDKETYFNELDEVIRKIKSGEARKVVLSRKKKLGRLSGHDYFKGFKKLCSIYPEAMVSMVSLASPAQVWLGASPEILVSRNKDNIFRTVSLAGTQSVFDSKGDEIKPIDALWTHKEIEEQALVSRYIINCLKKIRVREFDEQGPKTVRAGNLLHLKTFYKIDNEEVGFPNLSSVMLELLHPTPAICGMPKEDAERVLSETEEYPREFYSGYLGPVNVDEESHLYVNLRTMKIQNQEVYAYAGGGIMEDSIPEKEWRETEIKMETIAKAFDNFEFSI